MSSTSSRGPCIPQDDGDTEDALEICRQSPQAWSAAYTFADPMGLSPGQKVIVSAIDYDGRDPVEGELVASSMEEVVLRRHDERAGVVYLHFPRIGFEIAAPKP